jgi:hypothetical protein
MSDIIIKLKDITINLKKSNIINVDETPDGIVFNLKGGLDLLYSNQYMVNSNKQIIKNTLDKMSGKKIIIELDNLKQPVLIIGN